MQHAWGDETFIQNVGWKTGRGRDHSEDLSVYRRIILKCILRRSVVKCELV
jgi:hypothetical protein